MTIEGSAAAQDALERIAGDLGGTLGVAARNLATGASLSVNADETFPLAGLVALPVVVTVMRQVDDGRLRLDERLPLRESDKSPGGALVHCRAGLMPALRDLVCLALAAGDETATDMLWRQAGLESVNQSMRELGFESIDCGVPNRARYLVRSGLGSEAKEPGGVEAAARWRQLEARDGREAALARLLDDHAGVTGAALLRHRERLRTMTDPGAAAAFEQVDNRASPHDVTELLTMMAEARCASAPSCRLMVEAMSRQQWRAKIAAGLPSGTRVANLGGSDAGVSNDAAIVCGSDHIPLVLVAAWKGLAAGRAPAAPGAIATIAGVLCDRLAGPAQMDRAASGDVCRVLAGEAAASDGAADGARGTS